MKSKFVSTTQQMFFQGFFFLWVHLCTTCLGRSQGLLDFSSQASPIVCFVLSGVVFCLDFGPFFFLLLPLVMGLGPRLLDFFLLSLPHCAFCAFRCCFLLRLWSFLFSFSSSFARCFFLYLSIYLFIYLCSRQARHGGYQVFRHMQMFNTQLVSMALAMGQ